MAFKSTVAASGIGQEIMSSSFIFFSEYINYSTNHVFLKVCMVEMITITTFAIPYAHVLVSFGARPT